MGLYLIFSAVIKVENDSVAMNLMRLELVDMKIFVGLRLGGMGD